MVLSIITRLYNHHYNLFQNGFITPKGSLISISSHATFPFPRGLWQLVIYFVLSLSLCLYLPVLDISYTGNHTVCAFCIWLLSLSIFSRLKHVVPFLFMAEWIYHISIDWIIPHFICSSLGRCLGCACSLAVLNMLLWTFIHTFFVTVFFSCIYLGVELLGHMGTLYLTFWWVPNCFA